MLNNIVPLCKEKTFICFKKKKEQLFIQSKRVTVKRKGISSNAPQKQTQLKDCWQVWGTDATVLQSDHRLPLLEQFSKANSRFTG